MKTKEIVWDNPANDCGYWNGFIGDALAFKVVDYHDGKFRVHHWARNGLCPNVKHIPGITFDTREEAEIYCRTLGVKAILDLFLDETEGKDEKINI